MISKYRLIVHEQVKSPVAEAYRTLRTNLNFCKADEVLKTIMFTSAGPQEGKSLTAANMAIALAQTGKQVVIVDCDLRRPVQHKIFGKENQLGITNLLAGNEDELDDYIQKSTISHLYLLTSGPVPPNPSELLGSDKMKQIITNLCQKFDYVIFDVPPVIAVTDACVLASNLDGVVLVLGADIVRPEMAQKAKELLAAAKARLLGVVLNRIEVDAEHAYYYNYYGVDQKKAAGK